MVVGINDSPPSLPLALSRGAADGDEGFERLWLAYGIKKNIAKARAVFERISPDPALLQQMITAASVWRSAWRPDKRERKFLETWLAEQRYLEDPPTVRASSIAKAGELHQTVPIAVPLTPKARTLFVVESATDSGGVLTLKSTGGERIAVQYEAAILREQEAGQLKIAKLMAACGLDAAPDAACFVGKRFYNVDFHSELSRVFHREVSHL